jgi:hypothetical protein
MSETGSGINSLKSDHDFLFVFNTSFESMAYQSQVISTFSLVNKGGLSISAARGRARTEVTSTIESSTTVSYQCSIHLSCLTCTISKLYSVFDSFDR